MIKTIALHELRVFLRSPFAWITAAALQLILGWLLLSATEQYTQLQETASHSPLHGLSKYLIVNFLAPVSVVMMLITPLLCMNLIAGDKQSGRYVLFASAPINSRDIVLGKFIAAVTFQLAIISVSAMLVYSLTLFTQLDTLHLLSAYLGLGLFIVLATACSLLYSSLTNLPALAAVLSFATLLLLWMAASAGSNGLLGWLSPSVHLHSFMRGMLDTRDILYFVCVSALAIHCCIWRLDSINSFQASAH